jgi:SAM-dependent methyltransferase
MLPAFPVPRQHAVGVLDKLGTVTDDPQSAPDAHDQDVPSPIDLRDPADAATWAAEADAKRPWRAQIRTAFAALLRDALTPPLRILELGPGPGLLAEVILTTCQVERYTLFDFSPPMLEMCRQRLGDHAIDFVLGDFKQENWTKALSPPLDAVVTMQAVHELRHKRHAPHLYSQLRPLLRPGGMLVICDHTPLDDSARYRALNATVLEQHAALASAGLARITTHLTLHGLYLCSATRPE